MKLASWFRVLLTIGCCGFAGDGWTAAARGGGFQGEAHIRPQTVLDRDHAFDAGSGVNLSRLSKAQVENLVLLGKVWGFLKYHHPEVTRGNRHWDYDLFRIMPAVLSSGDGNAANLEIRKWIDGLGRVPSCSNSCFSSASQQVPRMPGAEDASGCIPCAILEESDLQLRPELDWIRPEASGGKELSSILRHIYLNRNTGAAQFYISMAPIYAGGGQSHIAPPLIGGNPQFDHEEAYAQLKLPDSGYQLLALYRFWNIIRYWFPYRDVIGEDWDGVLREFVPKIALAKTRDEFQLALMALIARVNDSHANLWSSLSLQPPLGGCLLPVIIRFIEGDPVVVENIAPDSGAASQLKSGDVLTELDGSPVKRLIEQWKPYYGASNEPARYRDIAWGMTRGACGETAVGVRRGNENLRVRARRILLPKGINPNAGQHVLRGEAFQILPGHVAYLKLSAVKRAYAAEYVKKASGTRGWIIDIRHYPSDPVLFSLGQLLVNRVTPFARLTLADLANPGAFHWGKTLFLTPAEPHYPGRLAILVDEATQSQAEYTAMAFRVAPGAIVIGSTTAAADGNVSKIPLPGGLSTTISGIGVFYPDKRPTQRVGILPDIEIRPTIQGVRTGKDEVLEAAIRWILAQSRQ